MKSLNEHVTSCCSDLQGTQIELSIGVTLGISTMAGKNMDLLSHSIVEQIENCI